MKKIFFLTISLILIPSLIVGFNHKQDIIYKIKYGSINNVVIKVKCTQENNIKEVPLEKYVLGVVAGEMPATFNIEALKAQAVASRTYALKRKENNGQYDVTDDQRSQVYIQEDKMKEKWKESYNQNLSIVKKAVNDTKGEVILYNNELIDAMFFSTSNGYTENSEDVFSNSAPYLVSVESSWDKNESPVFSSSNTFTKKEFLFNLGLNDNSQIIIGEVKKTNTGRIKSIVINNKTFEASTIRKIFNLKSTSFEIVVDKDNVTFNVNGYGHGVGLSQYGANGMAKSGYNYKQILKHYYKNSDVKKIN